MQARLRLVLAIAAGAGFLLPPSYGAPQSVFTGCLESAAGGFTLATASERFQLDGGSDLAKHAGHTVRLSAERKDGALADTEIEHLSDGCGRDRSGDAELTAQDQGTSEVDRETTAKIRKALVEDETLSTYAHNVKIVTREGRVTLLGPVRSAAEKAAVAAKAEAVLGDAVDDRLTVEPDRE